ncbi:MAG: ribosomal RNA small subunit methyltransferase E [Herpetosiphonaceae bacterium]|nr:MAG: ribosomal RNA small subunit methyltransferase E [Herpetosiphonaceae bacterium]
MERNTYRFFVPPESFHGAEVAVDDRDLAHQLKAVLRLQPGAEITLLDGRGQRYHVELTALDRNQIRGRILERGPAGGEPHTRLTIYAALIKAERFEWLLQKGTELGVTRFVPLVSERSLPGTIGEAKQARWQRILREAAEQSLRGRVPELCAPMPFAAACNAVGEQGFLLWEAEGGTPLRVALRQITASSLAILSGPEGGFTNAEAELARQHGVRAITLGPRILRAETAPLVAAVAILYERDDLR